MEILEPAGRARGAAQARDEGDGASDAITLGRQDRRCPSPPS